ncbi:hypothetical protein CVD28_19145 [Bacillus sp. M6-12]|uniref:hypothetical protein n=1 Tax=Bacillus sp. M6-12 TaxID=2054166 RepID=UPI000C77BB3B|nr:hypothetical protein [Bacillus sp. M6-12]PLS16156.1 hypothetical protein CVD28_19145 [Bacillus sp. M6-12]
MTQHEAKSLYLKELEKKLYKHPGKQSILKDYEAHLSDLLEELSAENRTSQEWLLYISEVIGKPEEVAASWKEELSVTHNKTFLFFLSFNAAFFAAGGLLTVFHLIGKTAWIYDLWHGLTSIPMLIMGMYMLFWVLLGYEIGKSFGAAGNALMQKTFLLSLIPNLGLMLLVLFRIIPHEWFHPLLSETFITLCIAGTIILYPLCWLGYRWGKKKSV